MRTIVRWLVVVPFVASIAWAQSDELGDVAHGEALCALALTGASATRMLSIAELEQLFLAGAQKFEAVAVNPKPNVPFEMNLNNSVRSYVHSSMRRQQVLAAAQGLRKWAEDLQTPRTHRVAWVIDKDLQDVFELMQSNAYSQSDAAQQRRAQSQINLRNLRWGSAAAVLGTFATSFFLDPTPSLAWKLVSGVVATAELSFELVRWLMHGGTYDRKFLELLNTIYRPGLHLYTGHNAIADIAGWEDPRATTIQHTLEAYQEAGGNDASLIQLLEHLKRAPKPGHAFVVKLGLLYDTFAKRAVFWLELNEEPLRRRTPYRGRPL